MRRRMLGVSVAAVLVACGDPSSARDSPQPSAGETADRLVIGLPTILAPADASPFLAISNMFIQPQAAAIPRLVHAALYRYDDSFAPVPDLAAEPCAIGADQVTITCKLVEATFHDGTPVTADDVAYTYELARRSGCTFGGGLTCLDTLESVTAIDERTVTFELSQPDATFLTLALPTVLIESRAVVEAAYEPVAERGGALPVSELEGMSTRLAAVLAGDQSGCAAAVGDVGDMLEQTGLAPTPSVYFEGAGGELDACLLVRFAQYRLDQLTASVAATGLDAVALAYPALSLNWEPIGAGPWQLREVESGPRIVLEAAPGYHLGPAATYEVEVRSYAVLADAIDAVREGEVDWVPNMFNAPAELDDETAFTVASYDAPGYLLLAFNLREGRLFADRNLREALELCIDKPATVDAASAGDGSVIYSPIEPISWAYRADLPRPDRDVDEARRLIEESGWRLGEDELYQRDGRRLATDVYANRDDAPRVKFIDLVSEQALDCGIELNVIAADPNTVFAQLGEYPHVPPDGDQPFDAMMFAWIHGYDPHDILFDSRHASSEEQPAGLNVMGFNDPRVDELLDQGIATYDQRERARIYREYQTILAEERPVLFAWAYVLRDAISPSLRAAGGGDLNFESGFWWWRLDELIVGEDAT